MENDVLAIDLGNTIIKKGVVLPDAFRVIRRLIDERFGEKTHIVSRVNEPQEIRARAFVGSDPFIKEVRIPIERVHFCAERHEKGPICKKLGVTHMIDDRPDVLIWMPECVREQILFNPTDEDIREHETFLDGKPLARMKIVRSWIDVERLFFPAR